MLDMSSGVINISRFLFHALMIMYGGGYRKTAEDDKIYKPKSSANRKKNAIRHCDEIVNADRYYTNILYTRPFGRVFGCA